VIFNLLEKNKLPDFLIRFGIRRLLKVRLEEEEKGDLESQQKHLNDYIQSLKESPVAVNTKDANEQHYEVPTEFYKYVLGKRMKYSGGLWNKDVDSLDTSEEDMLALSVERAEIKNGQTVLELGCGWGSMSLYIAEKFPKCKVTGVSNSKTQKEYIDAIAKERGLKNVKIITMDMNVFTIATKFDRIVSVEMLEHMKNYQSLFKRISGFLKDDGKFFVHIFTHKTFAYPFEVRDESDWMAKYFFTGGMMPSHDLFLHFQDDISILKQWTVDGRHYGKTSEAWLKNMDSNREKILPIFEKTYGKENITKWWVYWRVFFMSCAELWNFEEGQEWIVSHYLFAKKNLG
jgi:cyclopropane-fatty-acyl-phospholipid synthase